jgi:hypothetical protein
MCEVFVIVCDIELFLYAGPLFNNACLPRIIQEIQNMLLAESYASLFTFPKVIHWLKSGMISHRQNAQAIGPRQSLSKRDGVLSIFHTLMTKGRSPGQHHYGQSSLCTAKVIGNPTHSETTPAPLSLFRFP